MGDKHWGRRGPLYCLTSGYGDVAWVRLDDAKSHFGVSIIFFCVKLLVNKKYILFYFFFVYSLVDYQPKVMLQHTHFCVQMVIYNH